MTPNGIATIHSFTNSLIHSMLLLSLFCGIDLLGAGFQDAGFVVVQAGDIIMGKDIRHFRGIPDKFEGIIAGSPCQDFSAARRSPPSGYGIEMIQQFERIVRECSPRWWLLENVPSAPSVNIEKYHVQRFFLNALECGSTQNRHRYFQFGHRDGVLLDIPRLPKPPRHAPCCVATEGTRTHRRTWAEFCELQGIAPLSLPDLTQTARYKVVGNAVNYHVALTIGAAVARSYESPITMATHAVCACGCGRLLTGRQRTATPACRKRLSVLRRKNN